MPQKFRGRNGPYTSLDCYSTPYGTTQHLPTRQPARYAQVEPRGYEEAGSFDMGSSAHVAAPVYHDHDQERFRGRNGPYTTLDVYGFKAQVGNPAQLRRSAPQARAAPPPARAVESGPATDDIAGWLQQAIGATPQDAYRCASLLFADGCRYVDDVYMLVGANELPAQIPKVMRMKIAGACEAALC